MEVRVWAREGRVGFGYALEVLAVASLRVGCRCGWLNDCVLAAEGRTGAYCIQTHQQTSPSARRVVQLTLLAGLLFSPFETESASTPFSSALMRESTREVIPVRSARWPEAKRRKRAKVVERKRKKLNESLFSVGATFRVAETRAVMRKRTHDSASESEEGELERKVYKSIETQSVCSYRVRSCSLAHRA